MQMVYLNYRSRELYIYQIFIQIFEKIIILKISIKHAATKHRDCGKIGLKSELNITGKFDIFEQSLQDVANM